MNGLTWTWNFTLSYYMLSIVPTVGKQNFFGELNNKCLTDYMYS
jgi:hypothetical protein